MSENTVTTAVNNLQEDISAAEDTIKQFVTFQLGDEMYAVEMSPVKEIIRVPETVRVPLAPSTLIGLANLRGKVLPIVNLRRMLGLEEVALDEASRAIVIKLEQTLGFVVDRVTSVISVDKNSIETVDDIRTSIDSDLVEGVIKRDNKKMIMILDIEKLIKREFQDLEVLLKEHNKLKHSSTSQKTDEQDDELLSEELQLVSFEINGQEYAISIENVKEIVQVPDEIIHVPQASSYVLGIISLRNRLLPVISLRMLFGMNEKEVDDKSRIVVVNLNSLSLGLMVDNVNEVLRVHKSVVEPVPPIFSAEKEMSEITDICRLEDGKRIVSIIAVNNLFDNSMVKEALEKMEEIRENYRADEDIVEDSDDIEDDEKQLVVFKLQEEEFGVPIENVQEIVRVPDELTRVPKAPDYVEGVINLRGMVLPIIDLRKRMDMPSIERNDRQRIIVFLVNGIRVGFIVDSVSEVLKVSNKFIEPAPQLSIEQAQIFQYIANLKDQKRIIQIIDPSNILKEEELKELDLSMEEEKAA